ncbi:hypothetical protein [Arthrobacter sp. NIO-1057]|nr:hypothetical protein [Arthrobacter sp. NIO-1057]
MLSPPADLLDHDGIMLSPPADLLDLTGVQRLTGIDFVVMGAY